MKSSERYATATAFRVALEERLKRLAREEGLDLQRVRRQVAFDRLLCRLSLTPDGTWLLKGGYAMELRLKTARTTRDMDIAVRRLPDPSLGWDANVDRVLESLRELGRLDLQDWFTFVFGDAGEDLDAAPSGGARFQVDARLDGRTFAKFHLDVSAGDVLRQPYEALSGRDWLGFAGIASGQFQAVSPEEQFAEKLHAYTLPRAGRENTRVKDLVDLALLIERTTLNPNRLSEAISETFKRRATHPVPSALPTPPASWEKPFAEMALECEMESGIGIHFAQVAQFLRGLNL